MWWLTPVMVRPMAKNAPFWSRQSSEPYVGRPQSLPAALWVNWRDSFPQPLLTKEALRALSQLVSPLAHFAGWSATGRLIHGPPSFRLLTTDLSELCVIYPPPPTSPTYTIIPKKITNLFAGGTCSAIFTHVRMKAINPWLEYPQIPCDHLRKHLGCACFTNGESVGTNLLVSHLKRDAHLCNPSVVNILNGIWIVDYCRLTSVNEIKVESKLWLPF